MIFTTVRALPLCFLFTVFLPACAGEPSEGEGEGEEGEGEGEGEGSNGASCVPGEQQACACDDGDVGAQTCAADGASFDACVCAPCEPLESCEDVGAECGVYADGCGGFVSCTCGDGASCDEGNCVCDDGFAGDGLVCTALVNECALGLDDCGTNATCTDAADGFTCACNAGLNGDGIDCFFDDDFVADLSASPALVVVGAGTAFGFERVPMLARGLSRVGWEIPVTSVPVSGNNHKLPDGPAVAFDIEMTDLVAAPNEAGLAIGLIEGSLSDGTPLFFDLQIITANGTQKLALTFDAVVVATNTTAVGDEDGVVIGGFTVAPTNFAIVAADSTEPPNVLQSASPFLPGNFLEIAGIAAWGSPFVDVDFFDVDGPISLRRVPQVESMAAFALDAYDASFTANPDAILERRAMSDIVLGANGNELERRNAFEIWVSRAVLFEPTRNISEGALDVIMQTDLAEETN